MRRAAVAAVTNPPPADQVAAAAAAAVPPPPVPMVPPGLDAAVQVAATVSQQVQTLLVCMVLRRHAFHGKQFMSAVPCFAALPKFTLNTRLCSVARPAHTYYTANINCIACHVWEVQKPGVVRGLGAGRLNSGLGLCRCSAP